MQLLGIYDYVSTCALKRPRRIFKKKFNSTSDEHCVIRSDKNITSKMSMHKQSGLTKIIVCTPATTSGDINLGVLSGCKI